MPLKGLGDSHLSRGRTSVFSCPATELLWKWSLKDLALIFSHDHILRTTESIHWGLSLYEVLEREKEKTRITYVPPWSCCRWFELSGPGLSHLWPQTGPPPLQTLILQREMTGLR